VPDVPYRPEVCSYCNAETWCEIRPGNGKPQCRACKAESAFSWMYAHIRKTLLPWQIKDIRSIFGAVDPATGARKYRKAYDEKPKKNGKTFFIGGAPIYHLVFERAIEERPEGYGAAATASQAGLVFKAATQLIEANPDLRNLLRVYPSTKRIVLRDGRGFYQVLSSDGNGADGIEPSLALIDEVHRWTTAKAQTLWDVIWKGMISRAEPLGVMTTTAGDEDESLIWNQERDLVESILAGETQAPTYYVSLSQADERRDKAEPDYWTTREARVTANPSHEDNGGYLKDSALVEELSAALKKSSQGKAAFKRYHLGIRGSSTENAVIDMGAWMADGSGVDLREWPTYDYELLASKWGLIERPCVLGVDASWSNDLTALAAVFPPADRDPWRVLVWFWMPSGKVAELETKGQVPYSQWVDKGFIETCPGNANDYRLLRERAKWCKQLFDVRELAYDRWNFRGTAMELEEDGFTCVEVPQQFSYLSAPTKDLLVAYDSGRLHHGNNPVLNFCARSLSVQGDKKDNVQPAKPERMKTKKRIDGISATVTAWARAMVLADSGVDLDAFLNDPVRL
jgi:phage terminase large subunit-like protein